MPARRSKVRRTTTVTGPTKSITKSNYRRSARRSVYPALRGLPRGLPGLEIKKFFFDTGRQQITTLSSQVGAWAGTEIDGPAAGGAVNEVNQNMGCLNAVRKGTGAYNRIGNKLEILEIRMRVIITLDEQMVTAVVRPPTSIRIIICFDKESGGFAVGGEYVRQGLINAASNAITFYAHPQWDTRFKTIFDKIITLDNEALAFAAPAVGANPVNSVYKQGRERVLKKSIKFRKPVEIEFFTSANNNYQDIKTNSLRVFAGKHGDANTTAYAQIHGYFKFLA